MKREIQRKLMEENQELGEAEARKIRMEKVRSSPVLGPFLREIERRGKAGHGQLQGETLEAEKM
jgi:hypothetical protein